MFKRCREGREEGESERWFDIQLLLVCSDARGGAVSGSQKEFLAEWRRDGGIPAPLLSNRVSAGGEPIGGTDLNLILLPPMR